MLTLEFVTNTECNLGCYYCFASKKCKNDIITKENARKAVDLAYYFSNKINDKEIFFKFYGGEVMLFPELMLDVLSYINERAEDKNYELEVAIITNGTLITKEFIEKINKMKNIYIDFSISLEYSEEAHNRIRHYLNNKGNSFDDLLKSANNLLNYRNTKWINIQTVLSPDLLEHVEEYINLMEKYKNNFEFNLVPMFDYTFEGKEQLISNMSKLFDYYIKKFQENDSNHIGLFQPLRSISKKIFGRINSVNHCEAGVKQINIMPNGDCYPCSTFYHDNNREYKYGNLNNQSIEEIYEKFNSFVPLFKQLVSEEKECSSCKSINKIGCLGQCISHKLQKNKGRNIKSICSYNVEFGKQSNRLVRELRNDEKFIRRINGFFQAKKYPEMQKLLISGVKEMVSS